MVENRVRGLFRWLLLASVMLIGFAEARTKQAAHARFVLSSPDTRLAAKVPEEYTANVFGCTGGNSSPELHWTGAPDGTKSFVLTLFDPDEHGDPSGWWHWVVYDIPANVDKLAKGAGVEHSTALPAGTMQGRTDLGNDAYHGPCPDKRLQVSRGAASAITESRIGM